MLNVRRVTCCCLLISLQSGQPVEAVDLPRPSASSPLSVQEASRPNLRLGDERSSLEIYGQINKGLLIYNDGHSADSYFPVDNDNSSTRAGIWLSHRVGSRWSIAINVEGEWEPYSTGYVNQLTKGDVDWDSALLRKLEVYLDVHEVGRFWFGQGSMASDGTAEIDLSGTAVVGHSAVADPASAQLYRLDDGTLSSVSIGSTFNNLDGLGRRLRARYDSPSFHGFTVSTSVGQVILPRRAGDVGWDATLRYNADLPDYKIAAAISLSDRGSGTSKALIDGSASVLHVPSGWSITAAAGYEKQTERRRKYGYAKLGHQADYFDVGNTAYSVDLYFGDDIQTSGSESWSVGGQLVQQIDPWRSELYLGIRSFRFDQNTNDYKAGFSVLAGARVRF